MPETIFSRHALDRLTERGITREEVETTILNGERIDAKAGRMAYRKNYPFAAEWKNRYYEIKQVLAIVVKEGDALIVVTAYGFYFGGKNEN